MKYVVVKSDIDFQWRVMCKEDAPYGVCFCVANSREEAIRFASVLLEIDANEIEDY